VLRFFKRLLGGRSAARRPSPPPPRPHRPPNTDTPPATGAPDLLLYKFDSCPFCRRVARVIDDLDLDIATRDTRKEDGARAELRQRTGRTQVPCLFIDGEPLFESADIADWLRANADRIRATSPP